MRKCSFKNIFPILGLIFFLFPSLGSSSLPFHKNEEGHFPTDVLVRADLYQGLELPSKSMMRNTYTAQNDFGDYAFSFMTLKKGKWLSALWYKGSDQKKGMILYTASEDNILSDPSMNQKGDVVFSEFSLSGIKNVFVYSKKTRVLSRPVKNYGDIIQRGSHFQINDEGLILFRSSRSNDGQSIYCLGKDHLIEKLSQRKEQGLSYLFGPKLVGTKGFVVKVREGDPGEWEEKRPDSLRFYSFKGTDKGPLILHEDRDRNSASLFKRFDNSMAASPDGKWLAFIANLKDGKRILVRQKLGGPLTIISKEGVEGVKKIEFFSPSINDSGYVSFRGIGEDGKHHIYFAGANVMTVLLSENQKVSLDQGEGVIFAPEGPSFGGQATLNNKNEVLVRARVFKIKDQVDLGQALFRIQGPID